MFQGILKHAYLVTGGCKKEHFWHSNHVCYGTREAHHGRLYM